MDSRDEDGISHTMSADEFEELFKLFDPDHMWPTFQKNFRNWVVHLLGQESMDNKAERAVRVLEEVAETAQSLGVTREEAHKIIDQVYDKPVEKDVDLEIGGSIFTLAVLAESCDINLMEALKRAFRRGSEPGKMAKIREANKSKVHAGGYEYHG